MKAIVLHIYCKHANVLGRGSKAEQFETANHIVINDPLPEELHGGTSLDAAISKHDSHESINLITRNVTLTEQFRFKRVTHNEVLTRLTKINVKKAVGPDGIPPKLHVLKIGAPSIAPFLTNMINKSIDLSIYPSDFKEAYLSPVFKKDDHLNKLNFRPISLLKVMSKIHEGMLSEQLLSGVPDFFDRNKSLSGGDLSHYQVPHCIRVFFYFVWFVFIHHNFQFYFE